MEEIKVGDLTVKPALDKNMKNIHPAIGVIDDTAYVGIWLPCEIMGKKGNIAFRDLLFLVTDKRELILANDQAFRDKGFHWRLAYKPIKFENRWDLKNVQAYINGASVNPQQILNHLVDVWREYMELSSDAEYVYHALWDVGTYLHHLFNAYPYPYFGGVKRSGKTKALMLHSCLDFNSFFSNNMSTSSIYRLIQNARGTLLIDETEKLSQPDRALEFRSILLSGYKKGAKVYRVEKTRKEMLQPEAFEVYSPKALANIRGLEDVLEDRCKVTILRKSAKKELLNREVEEGDSRWSELRSELYVFYLTFWKEIKAIHDEISEGGELSELVNFTRTQLSNPQDLDLLVGRELEMWKPILTLALFFDRKGCVLTKFTSSPNSLTSRMLNLAIEDAKQRQIENVTETGEAILLQILTQLVTDDDYYPVKTLKTEMAKAFDEEQKWLTTRWIGSALKRLGFMDKRRVGTGYQYFLKKKDVEGLAERMGVPPAEDYEPIKVAVKTWCIAHRDERSEVSLPDLATFIQKELEQDPQRVTKLAFDEAILMPSPKPGKAVAV